MPQLAERYTVIAPDLIGHGRSAKPRGDYSLGAYAAGVRDLIAVLGYERGTVIGHSFGGGIAMQFSYLFPEYVERMALISSGGLGREVHPLLRAATLPGSEWVLPLIAREWPVRAGDAIRSVAAKIGIEAGPDLAEFARGYASLSDEGASDAFIHTMRGVIDHDGQRVSALDRLYLADQMATLIIWGYRRPGDPHRARPPCPRDRRAQPLRGDPGLRPLADARRPGSRRRRDHRLHGGDRAIRLVARGGPRAASSGPRWVIPRADRDRPKRTRSHVDHSPCWQPATAAPHPPVAHRSATRSTPPPARWWSRSCSSAQCCSTNSAASPRSAGSPTSPSGSPGCPAGRPCPAPSWRTPC